MKALARAILVGITSISILLSCEDAVDIDLENEAPRLVVEAWVKLIQPGDGNNIVIRCTTTSGFLETVQPAFVDEITLSNETTGESISFEANNPDRPATYNAVIDDDAGTLDQVPISFFQPKEALYTLTVVYEGITYEAQTQYAQSAPITITQGAARLEDEAPVEVTVSFTDIPTQENFYMIQSGFGNLFPVEDRFFENNTITVTYEPEINPDADRIAEGALNYGVTKEFYTYLNAIIEQSELHEAAPFQTTTATIRGNFYPSDVNTSDILTNPDHFILGFFAISERYDAVIELE